MKRILVLISTAILAQGCDEPQKATPIASVTIPPAASISAARALATATASAIATIASTTTAGVAADAPAAPAAEPADYKIDVSHSRVGFGVKHMMVSTTRGNFKKFAGVAFVDEKDLSKTKVELTIDVDSIDSGDPARDKHLRSEEFFDVKKFPKATFKSKNAVRSGAGYKLTGDLTIRDVTKEVTLDIEALTKEVLTPFKTYSRGVHAATKINRSDFGLKWNKALETGGVAVGEEVTLDIDLELQRPAAATPATSASGSASAPATAAPSTKPSSAPPK
jgi:polyisoprenoid-binding protein YceI